MLPNPGTHCRRLQFSVTADILHLTNVFLLIITLSFVRHMCAKAVSNLQTRILDTFVIITTIIAPEKL